MLALRAAAADLGATLELVTDHPSTKRCVLRRGDETTKVDLVLETVPQAHELKRDLDGIRVDPPEEIFANKLCTLLSRGEPRDLVDLRALERAGYSLEAAFPLAMRKDGGLTPAQLRDVLRDWRIGGDALIHGVPAAELDAYRRELIDRLARMAFPGPR